MELQITACEFLTPKKDPIFTVSPGNALGSGGTAIFDLTFINHRSDRQEFIRAAYISIKKRRFWFWKCTIATGPVKCLRIGSDILLENIAIPPMSASPKFCASSDIRLDLTPDTSWEGYPRYSEMVLTLDMIGPLRKIERRLETFKHSRKNIHND